MKIRSCLLQYLLSLSNTVEEISLGFSTKYRLVLCNIRLCAIAVIADAPALIQWRSTIFFREGTQDVSVTVERVVRVYAISSRLQPGECCRIPQPGLGRSPSRKRFLDVLYATLVQFYACFSVFWKLVRDNNTKNTRKYNWGWYRLYSYVVWGLIE